MSSRTSPFASKEDAKELKTEIRNVARNVGAELQNLKTQNVSIAICFDAFLEVIDEAMPGTSDKLKAKLTEKQKKPEAK